MKITKPLYSPSVKHLLLLVAGMLLSSSISAQNKKPYYVKNHQLGMGLGIGSYKNTTTLPFGLNNHTNASFNVELDYQYRFSYSKKWKLGIAVGYQQAKFSVGRDHIASNTDAVDFEGDPFVFKYFAKTYEETWSINQLNIPLTIEYSTLGVTAFYFRTGIQYSVQLKNKVDLQYNNLQTSGYFPQWDVELTEPQFAGFGHFELLRSSEEIKLDDRWAWIAEVGLKQRIDFNQYLYFGFYFDIGLNDQIKNLPELKNDVLNYNPEPGNALQTISVFQTNAKEKTIIRTYSIGLKIRYAL